MTGPSTDVKVTLSRFGHSLPAEVDVLLVSPRGTKVSLMSGNCGGAPIEDYTWTFTRDASDVMGNGSCDGFVYRPSPRTCSR